jgi:hypothetical protein
MQPDAGIGGELCLIDLAEEPDALGGNVRLQALDRFFEAMSALDAHDPVLGFGPGFHRRHEHKCGRADARQAQEFCSGEHLATSAADRRMIAQVPARRMHPAVRRQNYLCSLDPIANVH